MTPWFYNVPLPILIAINRATTRSNQKWQIVRVIITPMSERPHPERRPVDQLRPVNQVSQAREKARRAVEDNLYASEVLI